MTGVAFILYTFYMVTDPATTPNKPREQFLFGASVAVAYGFLMVFHIVFGLFFALTIVCTLRGLGMFVHELVTATDRKPAEMAARPVVAVTADSNGHRVVEEEPAAISATARGQ